MNTQIDEMLRLRAAAQDPDKKNLVKEILQEIVLCGLSRAGFFKKAAFYGGTALRIFYGLDRFSEDLDFSLVMSDSDFRLDTFLPFLEKELLAYGFHFQAESKNKAFASDIQSAFVKGGTREHILLCFADERLARTIGSSEGKLRIIIADDGTGCENVKQGFGLRHMKERLELLHGSLNFWNDAGFIVEAEIPMNQEEDL